MDEDTSLAIDGLRGDIRDVETSLRSEIRDVQTSLRSEIREVETSLRSEIREVEGSLRAEIGRVEVALGDRIDDARRHTDVLIESVRDDIRMVAAGVVSIQQQVTDLSRKR